MLKARSEEKENRRMIVTTLLEEDLRTGELFAVRCRKDALF